MRDYRPRLPMGLTLPDPGAAPAVHLGPHPVELERAERRGRAEAGQVTESAALAARRPFRPFGRHYPAPVGAAPRRDGASSSAAQDRPPTAEHPDHA